MAPDLVVELRTAAATQRLGRRLGALLQPGDLLGLDGPLGAGKTCLVQGLARGLGVPADVAVSSPTFTLVNQYAWPSSPQAARPPEGKTAGAQPATRMLYHVDLYRLESARELDELGLWEAAESGGIMAIEWLSRFPQALPADRLELQLDLRPTGGRTLRLSAGGPRSADRLEAIRRGLGSGSGREKARRLV